MQAGQKAAVQVRAVRADGSVHRGTAVAHFYAPGTDPEHVPADRSPARTAVLGPDPAARGYAAELSTAGWAPGDWTVQAVVLGPDGAPEGWAWYRLTLEP